MDIYEEVTRTTTKRELKDTLCDICGCSTEQDKRPYQLYECEVRYRDMNDYGNDADWDEFNPDICPKCMKEIIIPFVESKLKPGTQAWHSDSR